MEIDIISDRLNPLTHRREIKFIIKYDGPTPSIKEVKEKIVALQNLNKELTIVDTIAQEFGATESNVYVKVYDDEKYAKMFEKKSTLEKNKIEEETTEEQGE